MAVMSPQTSASTTEHKQSISTPTSDNPQAEETTAMDLDVNGTNKEESTTAPLQDPNTQSSSLEAGRNQLSSPIVNGSSKGIAAPPSPPIPTPPLHLSIDGTENLSDLHITSPPGNITSMTVDELRSSPVPKSEEALSPGTKMDMDEEPISPLTTTAATPTNVNAKKSKPPRPPTISTDHEMMDAPVSIKTAREREDDDEDAGRPTKRAKTDEIDDQQQSLSNSASAGTGTATAMPKIQQKHALQALRTVRRTKDSGPFQTPVDVVKLNIPTYFEFVKHPMDLSTMEKKLLSDQYVNVEQFTSDFNQIIANCLLFNGPEHKVSEMARRIEATFERQMKNMPPPDQPEPPEKKSHKKGGSSKGGATKTSSATPKPTSRSPAPPVEPPAPTPPPPPPPKAPAKAMKAAKGPSRKDSKASAGSAASPTFAVGPSGIPQIRRESTSAGDGRPKREIHPPPPRDLPYTDVKPRRKKTATELKFCDNVIKEVMKKQYEAFAFPFYTPVDPVALNIPDYFKIIKKPMDLSTIQGKLKTNQYDSANEFESDIKLMLANCYKFNPAGSPVNMMGKKFEELFNKKWAEKSAFIQSQSGSRSPVSASPPPEDEEELSEDEVDGDENLASLQEQLEAVMDKLSKIKKSKSSRGKAAPAAVTKKSKSGGTGGRKSSVSMPATSVKKGGKKGGSKRTEDYQHITLDQKLELSHRINLLSPPKMVHAMTLIQNSMPSLAGDGEIELDIDELPAPILWKLHQYVSKHAPPIGSEPEPDEYVPAPAAAPKKAAPRPKKNKPMSAHEQEAKIKDLQAKLENFDNPHTAKAAAPPPPADSESESSEDDESSGSESEEE